jgi:uncharacterized protein
VSRRTVTVTGSGTATAAPDLAVVHLRADALRPTAAEAVGAAQDCVDRVRAALREAAGDATAGSTTLSLHAEETWEPDPRTGQNVRRRTGFRAGHGLRVEVRDVARLGAVLTAVLGAGGDDLALDRVDHDVADPTTLRDRARAAAWDDARHRAAAHAEAAGAGLGAVAEVVEHQPGDVVPFAGRGLKAMAAEVSVEPGGVDVVVQVRVTWELG